MVNTARANELAVALASSKRLFWHVGAFSVFINILMLTGSLYMLQVYDRVMASQSMPTLFALTLLILVLFATLGALEWVRSGLFGAASARFEALLGERAADVSLNLSLKDAGKFTDRPLRDLRSLRRFFAGPALGTVFDAPLSPIFFFVLFLLHPFFGIFAMLGAAILIGLGLVNQATTNRIVQESEELERGSQARSAEMVRSAEVLEALGMRKNVRARWHEQFMESDRAMSESGRILATFSSGTKAFRLFLQSAILGLGAWLAIRGDVSPGAMVASSILMGRAIAPIEQAVGMWRQMVTAREAWESLSKYLAGSPERPPSMSLPPIRGKLSVQNVFAAPAGSKKATLRGLNFEIEAGDVLGVIGPSAAGKTTLAKLLIGVWPALSGHVRLDGAELMTFDRDELGAQMGYLPQQVDLLSGTVRDNISRFRPNATDEDVVAAAKAAECHDLILHLPEGYQTDVGTAGAYLSAGQRQRIGLARALFGKPNFIVLDEPNSNLDAAGDEALQAAILNLKERGATVVIIAHRPAAIQHCNMLLVIDGGEMKAFGPSAEVLAKLRQGQTNSVRTIRGVDSNG
jgi:PrtD family type I secretion system ABC transporter